ncbi:hypothetical protein PVL29_015569 [Vitis rotundifolia]|uniref:FAS1 domain-containing protein n=1 Tax=Vitis rotundifolia TaxID=103349 RepID=A0AA38ZD19_VITRO|nr:hypothetical protein PVL29_015569 [Vitis rotundifolia]
MGWSCCHWWHAPVYVALAFIAISTPLHSNLKNAASPPPSNSITHHLLSNASRALRRSGFTVIATLLQASPELFLSSHEYFTIFAIKDSAISNFSHPPWLMKHLFHYHTSPSKLSMHDLLEKPPGSCLSTLLQHKKLSITKTDATQRSVEINHVLVSHPDVFLGGPISVHGVLGPFSPLNPQDLQESQWGSIQTPICGSNSSVVESRNLVEWPKIIRMLSSNGFVSFAVGLHTVLDLALSASPSPLLDRIVRFHILPRRLSYIELASLPQKAKIGTLLPDRDLEVTGRVKNSSQVLVISGVDIVAPDVFSSKKFIIHVISRAFKLAEFPNAF